MKQQQKLSRNVFKTWNTRSSAYVRITKSMSLNSYEEETEEKRSSFKMLLQARKFTYFLFLTETKI